MIGAGWNMCGIHAAIYTAGQCPIPSAALERRLRCRGPDYLGTVTTNLGANDAVSLSFTSTVLCLRGNHIAKQPLVDETTGSVLCWNGEAWKIRGEKVHGNDSEAVLSLLSVASRRSLEDDGKGMLDALREIEGPFAFIYFDKPAKRLYYARDRLGRRSLLVQPGEPFLLGSISDSLTSGWSEVEPDGIYTLQLSHQSISLEDLVLTRHDWVEDNSLVSPFTMQAPHRRLPFRLLTPHPFRYQESASSTIPSQWNPLVSPRSPVL